MSAGNDNEDKMPSEAELRKEFESKHWVHKVDERVDHTELEECIHLMGTFYKQRADTVVIKEEEESGLGDA